MRICGFFSTLGSDVEYLNFYFCPLKEPLFSKCCITVTFPSWMSSFIWWLGVKETHFPSPKLNNLVHQQPNFWRSSLVFDRVAMRVPSCLRVERPFLPRLCVSVCLLQKSPAERPAAKKSKKSNPALKTWVFTIWRINLTETLWIISMKFSKYIIGEKIWSSNSKF